MNVLIVDDSTFIVERIAELLLELDSIKKVYKAGSFAEGEQMFATLQPDVVLLDINLPDNTGINLLRKIRAQDRSVYIVMITNQSSDYYRRVCFLLGANFYVDKSVEFDKIPDIIHQIKDFRKIGIQ